MRYTLALTPLFLTSALCAPSLNRAVDETSDRLLSRNIQSSDLGVGFPNPSADQIQAIQQVAGGSLPTAPPNPISPSPFLRTFLSAVAHLESFESYYFNSLVANITNNADGYAVPKWADRQKVIDALTQFQAVEELHATNAQQALGALYNDSITPCSQYAPPVSDFTSALDLIFTATTNIYGTLGAAQLGLALNNATGLIRPVAGIVTNEAEQVGWMRTILGRPAVAVPFTTLGSPVLTWNFFVNNIIVASTCPDLAKVGLPKLNNLAVLDKLEACDVDKTVRYSIKKDVDDSSAPHYISYQNQVNVPVTVPATLLSDQSTGDSNVYSASFPYKTYNMNGEVIAVMTKNATAITSVDDMANPANVWGGPVFAVIN